MSDDEEDRLLIDDHDISGGPPSTGVDVFSSLMKEKQNEPSTDSLKPVALQLQNPFLGNGNNGPCPVPTLGQPPDTAKIEDEREEGELDDDVDIPVTIPQIQSNFMGSNPTQGQASALNWMISPSQTMGSGGLNQNHSKNPSLLSVDTSYKTEKSEPSPSVVKKPPSVKVSPGKPKKNMFDEKPYNGVGGERSEKSHAHHDSIKREATEKEDRKRPSTNKLSESLGSTKRHKSTKEKGTSMHSIAVQCDPEESIFDQMPGHSGFIQYTIVYKHETNGIYVSCRHNDRELYGFLTDGLPPNFAAQAKKRAQPNGNGAVVNDAGSEKSTSGTSTPSKINRDPKRGIRGSSVQNDNKKRQAADKEEEEEPVERSSRGGSQVITQEVGHRRSQHICPFDGCEHRYDRASEMEYHKATAHAQTKVMYDSRCSQTENWSVVSTGTDPVEELNPAPPVRESVEVQTDAVSTTVPTNVPIENSYEKNLTDSQKQSIELLMATQKVRRDTTETIPATTIEGKSSSPNNFSDISDAEDNAAPQLQKERASPRIPVPSLMPSLPMRTQHSSAASLSAFSPTIQPNEIKDMRSASANPTERKDSTISLPMAPSNPTAHSTAFQHIDPTKQRSVSVSGSNTQHSSVQSSAITTASPRPSTLGVPAAGPPSFMGIAGLPPGAGYPFVLSAQHMAQFTPPHAGPASATSPARPPESHKIHELKAKNSVGGEPSGGQSGHTPTGSVQQAKTPSLGTQPGSSSAPSPARQMPNPFMNAAPPGSAVQQMQQMAAAQAHQQQNQMMMMQMAMRGMPGFSMNQQLNPQEMQLAQFAQAMYAQQPHMFPK